MRETEILTVKLLEEVVTILMELKNMEPRIQAALDRATTTITDAINAAVTKETQELKQAIALAKGDPTEVENAIDAFAAGISNALTNTVDKISTDALAEGEPPPEDPVP